MASHRAPKNTYARDPYGMANVVLPSKATPLANITMGLAPALPVASFTVICARVRGEPGKVMTSFADQLELAVSTRTMTDPTPGSRTAPAVARY